MVGCPKCSSSHIHGPIYSRDRSGEEFLKYTCVKCGYTETAPTHDQKEKPKSLLEKMAEGARRPVSDRSV